MSQTSMSHIVDDMRATCQATTAQTDGGPVIAVSGVAGSGKTTLGRALARQPAAHPRPGLSDQSPAGLFGRKWATTAATCWWTATRGCARPLRPLRAAAADLVAVGSGVSFSLRRSPPRQGERRLDRLCAAVSPVPVEVLYLSGPAALMDQRRRARGEARDAFRSDAADRTDVSPAVPHVAVDASLTTAQQTFRAAKALGHRAPVDGRNPVFAADFDALLFDLDGTLVDSTPAVGRAWGLLGDEYGFDSAAAQRNHGMTALSLISKVVPADQVASAYTRITQLEAADTKDVIPTAGADALLGAIPPGASAIVTSGGVIVARARIAAAGLPPVRVLITADDVDRPKPDPQPFLLAADRLGVPASRCLAFEDSPAGAAGRRTRGAQSLGSGGRALPKSFDVDLWLDGLDRVRLAKRGTAYGLEPVG